MNRLITIICLLIALNACTKAQNNDKAELKEYTITDVLLRKIIENTIEALRIKIVDSSQLDSILAQERKIKDKSISDTTGNSKRQAVINNLSIQVTRLDTSLQRQTRQLLLQQKTIDSLRSINNLLRSSNSNLSAFKDSTKYQLVRLLSDQRNIKLNTDNSYGDPFFVSNIPGYRDTTYIVVIDTNTSLSGVIDLGNRRIKGIQMPASGWVPANLTFQTSYDNGVVYQTYWVDDVEFSMSATSGVNLNCNPRMWVGVSKFKIRSGTSAVPVNQTGNAASRTIKIRAGNY